MIKLLLGKMCLLLDEGAAPTTSEFLTVLCAQGRLNISGQQLLDRHVWTDESLLLLLGGDCLDN